MSSKKTKWGKRMAVVMAFALVVASIPGADAQAAKKAKLAKTKLTINVGKKKTIKIKNKAKKAKYTFKVKKASIAKVSKKGVVTAKKAGSTSITVKEKLGKKTRKLGNVKVTVKRSTVKKPNPTAPTTPITPAPPAASDAGQGGAANPTDVPVVTDEPTVPTERPTKSPRPVTPKPPTPTPTVKPTPTADPYTPTGKGWQKLDLSQWQGGSSENYLETGGQIVLKGVDLVTVPIPTSLENIGDKIEVLIRGSVPEGSQGFRYWLANDGARTMTTLGHYSIFGEGVEDPRKADEKDEEGNAGDPQGDLDPAAFKAGDFQVQRVLEHINKDDVEDIVATKLLLKASVYGGTLDGITITGIWVRYGDDIGNEDEPITPPIDTAPVETSDETNSYAVDFEKDKIIHTTGIEGVESTKEAADGVTTFTMPQFTGFVFVLPEDKDSDAYKYVTITYQSTGGMMVEMFDENTNVSDPDTSRGSTTKHVVKGEGKFPEAEEWNVVTYAVTDEFHNTSQEGNDLGAYDFSKGSFKGIQIFNMGGEATLKIKSIVFSEKEPGSEEPGTGEEDQGPAWTDIDMSKVQGGMFDKAAGTLTVNAEAIELELPDSIPAAGNVEVRFVGKDNGGSLFRCWAGGAANSRTSTIATWDKGMFGTFATDGKGGDFDFICNLTQGEGEMAGQTTNKMALKAYTYSGGIPGGANTVVNAVFTSISYRIVDEFTNK